MNTLESFQLLVSIQKLLQLIAIFSKDISKYVLLAPRANNTHSLLADKYFY